MRLVGLVLIAAIVVALLWTISRARLSKRSREGSAPPPAPSPDRSWLDSDLSRWVEAGLLTHEQAEAILAHEREMLAAPTAAKEPLPIPPRRPRRIPVVSEALGYLGGVLAITGLVLLVLRYWPHMAIPARLALTAGGAATLFGAGSAVQERDDPALARLRWFLWLGSSAVTALFALVLTHDMLKTSTATSVLASSGSVAVHSGIAWRLRERPLQQLACLGGLVAFAGSLVAEFASRGSVGLTVWFVGVVLAALGIRHLTPLPFITEAAGAIAVIAGAMVVSGEWNGAGLLLLVGSTVGMIAVAAVPGLAPDRLDQLLFAITGAVALAPSLPGALDYFGKKAGIATGLVTWSIGALLLLLGARHLVRSAMAIEVAGGAALIGGAALTAVQWQALAHFLGLLAAVALILLGMLPERVALSALGSIGLLVNTPWAIAWFFPGEGRAPLLIVVSGALLLGVSVMLTRVRGHFHRHHERPRHL